MSDRFGNDDELVRSVGELPRSIPPRRDLWPDIEARLPGRGTAAVAPEGASTAPLGYALAASVVIAFAAGVLLGRQMEPGVPGPRGDGQANVAWRGAMHATELEYRAAFRQFIPVGAAQSILAAQAVANIENSWLEFQQAEAALLAALAERPDNTYLNQKLLDLRAQQLEFMQQLATLDQFSRRKT